MAGGLVKYRHLSRNSAARKALLRGLVSKLVEHEHIQTTYAKAKEAQRLAEKLITHAKKDNEQGRRSAQAILYTPNLLLPKVFGVLKHRYKDRAGGYTRVVRTEPKNVYDQGESAILEFVDGPKDSRFMITAKAVARQQLLGQQPTFITTRSIKKITQFRGAQEFQAMVRKFMKLDTETTGPVSKAADEETAQLADRAKGDARRVTDAIAASSSKNGSDAVSPSARS
ncbi:hypothetical protein S40285_01318 [Stachybotrys chlorohalonatus IBT 40285]|uniref:Ribosomal protein L17 n=1 Tax=Stachybotrys chlorohalonatus (strain IBT 40285) TaxID=1283841 RepID=A0A084QQZ2_STAC4|nr:hypothetical protein S40285_01318 [Stachybotrys chlorohalonata IBT 40285]